MTTLHATPSTTAGLPIPALPAARAAVDPTGPCLSDPGRALDNATFAADVAALAGRFSDLGVGRGDAVAVLLPNSLEIVTTMFATWWRGAALTPINPALTDDEVTYQLHDSGTAVIVGDERAERLADDLGIGYVAVGKVDPAQRDTPLPPPSEPAASAHDFALIIYTSGTTGRPKGCVLDHANISAMVGSLVEHFALTGDDHSLLILPLFHCNGLLAGVLSPLLGGGTVFVAPRFDAATFWDTVEAERPTYFSAVPTIYAILESGTTRDVETSSLRFVVCGAAPMPAELIERVETRFDVALVEGYGLSECSVAATLNPLAGPRKAGTVGPALPGQEVTIVGSDGAPLPRGEAGEVVIKGANVMRGYLGKPEETGKVVRDGRLHTGDVGYLDEDGYLVLVDRLKDMIIRGGENIYPKEIEGILYAHPAVLEAAVVGAPDEVYGEVPVAYVALRSGHAVSSDDLIAHCRERLAKYKVPRTLHQLPSLPKNSVGKLVKTDLRAAQRPG